jgi:cyclophilin family peptidyl-prolyl cis-trans isomerase
VPTPPAQFAVPPAWRSAVPAAGRDASPAPAPAIYRVQFDTTKGSFIVQVTRKWAPHGADRFYELVRGGFFDDSRFFRVRRGFIAQFGIAGDPKRNAPWKPIPDDPVRESNARGTIAFAMTGPNTRLTQLYINLADNRRLDADGFAPIGLVVAGMDVVDKLYDGYGETSGGGMRGGKQEPLLHGGNAYLDRNYPKLDRIVRASVVLASR